MTGWKNGASGLIPQEKAYEKQLHVASRQFAGHMFYQRLVEPCYKS